MGDMIKYFCFDKSFLVDKYFEWIFWIGRNIDGFEVL